MKQRFSSLDVKTACLELENKVINLRLANVYDVNSRTFLFKFHKPEEKALLLVENGIRIHSTAYVREKQHSPSNFNIKLRKHLKSRRLTSLKQVNDDRIIDMRFGDGSYAYHLIFEFFAAGNIILTDHDYRIMSLMRVVDLEEQSPVAVGEIYNLKTQQTIEISATTLLEALKIPNDNESEHQIDTASSQNQSAFVSKKKMRKKSSNLRGILRSTLGVRYGPSLIDHAISISTLNALETDFSIISDQNSAGFQSLLSGFQNADKIIARTDGNHQGFILGDVDNSGVVTFQEFQPFLPAYYNESDSSKSLQIFDTFMDATDEFFSKVEGQRLQQKAKHAELVAIKKLDSVKENSANQIRNFQISQEKKELMALAIESNLNQVDSAIQTICSFVASGMDWGDLKQLVKEEQEKGNPLANLIVDLKLISGTITLSLPDPNFQASENDSDDFSGDSTDNENENSDEDDNQNQIPLPPRASPPRVLVDVDIYSTAFSNARSYYGAKKLAVEKGKKTIEASVKQLEIAEKKILQKLEKKVEKTATISKYRPPFWFEKFLWFISSENYLCISGRDAVQSELLIQKYMEPGDLFVNCDMEGSYGVVVKSLDKEMANIIPPTTLLQAGTMAICYSKAWEGKILTSAFWASHDKVTKKSSAGDSLPLGIFDVIGKKAYLPPVKLIYGIGLLFQVSEECVEGHKLERRPWARGGLSTPIQESLENITVDDSALDSQAIGDSVAEIFQSCHVDNGNSKEEIQVEDAPVGGKMPEITVGKDGSEEELELLDDEKSDFTDRDSKGSRNSKTNHSPKMGRGKKFKLKKINSKYADQDEEDREFALELLGSGGVAKPKGKKAKAEAEKQRQKLERSAEKEKNAKKEKDTAKKESKGPSTGKEKTLSSPNLSSVAIDNFQIPEVNCDGLTAVPNAEDNILFCIPVSAPWTCLQKYKYRLKLLPGSLKKGKAAKSAESLFLNMITRTKDEAALELVKQVGETEWINCTLAKVKIQTPQ